MHLFYVHLTQSIVDNKPSLRYVEVIHTIMQQKIHKRLTSMYFEKKVLLDNDVMSSLFWDPDEIKNRVSAYSHPWQKII